MILSSVSVKLFSTPDPERNITDVLLGFINNEVVIYQSVYDSNDSHNNGLYDKYIVIKKVENHEFVLKSKIPIKEDAELTAYINRKDFYYAIPDILGSKYFHLDENNKNQLYYFGVYYDLKRILPIELWVYNIEKVDQVYDLTDRVFVVINLISENKVESLKKVILLMERDK